MKNDDEVAKSVRETTTLSKDTLDLFQRILSTYKNDVTEGIQQCVEAILRDGRDIDKENELLALVVSIKEPLLALRKHRIQMQRGLKVVHHKNAVHANDRLSAALERMKQYTKDFRAKLDPPTKAKSARERKPV